MTRLKNSLWTLIILNPFFLTSCVVGFGTDVYTIPEEFQKVYVPSAQDVSVYAGQSSRLTAQLRKQLLVKSDLKFTDLENARWALVVKIKDKIQSVTAVDDCKNPGTPYVASGAYFCKDIHPELTETNQSDGASKIRSFYQPSLAPSSEALSLVVFVEAIDLNTGKVMWAQKYDKSNTKAVAFNVIGDNGDGRTLANMQSNPDLHALRHLEAIDSSVDKVSDEIVVDVVHRVFSYFQ